MLARRRLKALVSAEDLAAYERAEAQEKELSARWRAAYDAFIAEMDRQVKLFEPIAAKRNRIFEKAMKAAFKTP